jgi:SAM-dependent methyltransferase
MFLQEANRVLKPGGSLLLSDALISPVKYENRPYWDKQNFVTNLNEYAAICHTAGFSQVEISDVTKECWQGGFWNVVRFVHGKFLEGKINLEELNSFLDRMYRLTEDLEHYILVAARRAP